MISTQLNIAGMDSQICNDAAHAMRFLKNNFANLLLLDVHLPDQTGFTRRTSSGKTTSRSP